MSTEAIAEYEVARNAVSSIYAMRYSGATLGQIAGKIGKTKERVRQILLKNYGSTKHKLLSTRQLCGLSGLSVKRVTQLYQDGVIVPVKEWDTSNGHYLLWSPATVAEVREYMQTSHTRGFCRICGGPVPVGRQCYCSERCYKESHKYKHRSLEARQKHVITMRRYRESRRLLSLAPSGNRG